jgi:hypothetical protein
MLKAFKKFREICRKEAEVSQAMRRLATVPMDYQTIQTIADTVSSGYEVEITVKQPDGTTITIKRSKSQDQIPFEDFATRYRKYHNGDIN